MKRSKVRSFFKLLLALSCVGFITQVTAQAQGSKGGGGGSMVFKNGKWQLADKYILVPAENGQFMVLSEDMKKYIRYVQKLSQNFLPEPFSCVQMSEECDTLKRQQFFNDVLDPHTQYIFVDKLPCKDDPLELPDHRLKQKSFGCTKNKITYLLKDRYDSPGATVADKAFKLIHERWHAFPEVTNPHSTVSHRDIALYVASLMLMTDLDLQQRQGVRRVLNPIELQLLESFPIYNSRLTESPDLDLAPQEKSSPWQELKIHPKGGGVLTRINRDFYSAMSMMSFYNEMFFEFPNLAPDTFLSIDSRLSGEVVADGASSLNHVKVNGHLVLESAQLENAVAWYLVNSNRTFGIPQNIACEWKSAHLDMKNISIQRLPELFPKNCVVY